MDAHIRPYRSEDEEAVVALSLRAWAPVFVSMENVLGKELFTRLHGEDWRAYQARSVRDTLTNEALTTWVAAVDGSCCGFVVAGVSDQQRKIGEVEMLAVDPDSQQAGIGTALTVHATDWLRSIGMQVAMIGTGGDPGHAPARQVYGTAEYTLFPMARYFKAL